MRSHGNDNFALVPLIPHEKPRSFYARVHTRSVPGGGGDVRSPPGCGGVPSHGSDLTTWWRGATSILAAAAAKAGAGCRGSSNGTFKRGYGSYRRGNRIGGASTILRRDFPAGPC